MQAGHAVAQANAASGVLLLLTKLRPGYFIVLKSALRQVALVCWSWAFDCACCAPPAAPAAVL